MSRPIPKAPPRFDALLFATRIGGAATDDSESSGFGPNAANTKASGQLRIPIDRYARLKSWSSFVWDNGQAQTISVPAQTVVFRLYLEQRGTQAHTAAGQTVIATSQQGAADSKQADILLLPNDVLIASWRGIANPGGTGYCRLLGDYVLI